MCSSWKYISLRDLLVPTRPCFTAVPARFPQSVSRCTSSSQHLLSFSSLRLRYGSWNSAALFASSRSPLPRRAWRYERLAFLLKGHDILCLQETHGYVDDLDSLRRGFPNFIFMGTFLASGIGGGSVICIRKGTAAAFSSAEFSVVQVGRICALSLYSPSFSLHVVCVHIDPASSSSIFSSTLKKICKVCPTLDDGILITLGDFNFVFEDEGRFYPQDKVFRFEETRRSRLFSRYCSGFTEFFQPDFTRRQVLDGKVYQLSRLDHGFTNAPPAALQRSVLTGGTSWPATSLKVGSDHVPISFLIRPLGVPDEGFILPLPSWVSKHKEFLNTVNAVLLETGPLPACPFLAHDRMKLNLHEASKRVKRLATMTGTSSGVERVFWATRAFFSARDPSVRGERLLGSAIQAMPCLMRYSHDGFLIDGSGLCSFIAECMRERLDDELAAIDSTVDLSEAKKIRARDKISRISAAWCAICPRLCLQAVRRDNGTLASSLEESASLLCNFWSEVGAEKGTSEIDMEHFRDFVPRISFDDSDVILSIEAFEALVSSRHDSGVGPDGLPYSAWGCGLRAVIDPRYQIYLGLFRGVPPAASFGRGFLLNILKSEADDDDVVVARCPGETRPLTVSDSDGKIVSGALDAPLSTIARDTILEHQRGCLRGRSLVDNVVEADGYVAAFALLGEDASAAMLCCDFRAAFPSLEHGWIWFVLELMGIPAMLLVAIRLLYLDLSVLILFCGKVFPGFRVLRGIKQGDPMSGTIFVLAIEPFLRKLAACAPKVFLRVLAFADDIMLIFRKFLEHFGIIFKQFVVFAKASGLCLSFPKTVLVPLWDMSWDDLRTFLKSFGDAGEIRSADYAKYLGVFLGLGAETPPVATSDFQIPEAYSPRSSTSTWTSGFGAGISSTSSFGIQPCCSVLSLPTCGF